MFGLIACSSTMEEMDEIIQSAAVLFNSACSGDNVARHSKNLHRLLQKKETFEVDDKDVVAEDYMVIKGITQCYIDKM